MKKTDQHTLYSIGHSTHPIDEFLFVLKNHDITQLIDVRTIPHSRYNPQYDQAALSQALAQENIVYMHMSRLGGLRKPRKESVNQGLRNSSFRGYADYMQTIPFEEGLHELIVAVDGKKTAMMCAEALPWRCHRSMIADALMSKGWKVIDIMDASHQSVHAMHPVARVQDGRISYPKAIF
jgi:uncharacterized protein (DUF488 family)